MSKETEFWREVRRAYENGEGTYRALAERFGMSYGSVVYQDRKSVV